MSNREAIDTITGYFYQFDKTILELLNQDDGNASVCIEGIEDIDVLNADETSAIQCKYYAKTEYNHSVIKKPIILMLRHYAKNKQSGINYHLYGHYKSGHKKLKKITIESLKNDFLTYTKAKVKYFEHNELSLNDHDLTLFLEHLMVDIQAPSLEVQFTNIIDAIKENLNVSNVEAELYHYNSALKVIKSLSIKQNKDDRSITKNDFIRKIQTRDEIFDAWFIRRKGREKYIKLVKKEYLSSGLNMDSFDRFFLFECCGNEDLADIKEIILLVARKWSKISPRQQPSFCPSIYIKGLSTDKIHKLINIIYSEGVVFIDAYPFKGSKLFFRHFYTEPTIKNKIQFRFVESIEDLNNLISKAVRNVEIYQFFMEEVFFEIEGIKNKKIKIESIDYIKDMTK